MMELEAYDMHEANLNPCPLVPHQLEVFRKIAPSTRPETPYFQAG